MFKVNLFVHSAGRRLDQRSRRMLAVVSLPSQRSVRPGETTACYKQQTVQADMFSKTICNPFQSSLGLSIRACFCSCRVIYTFFCRFERWFHSIFRSSYCQDFEKCRDIPPLSMRTAVNSCFGLILDPMQSSSLLRIRFTWSQKRELWAQD